MTSIRFMIVLNTVQFNLGFTIIHDEKKNKILAILNGGNEIDDDIQSLIDNRWQGLLEDYRS